MRTLAALLAAAALSACKVEPTPRTFYNHRDPAVVELEESEGEIRTRVLNFATALNRGDTTAALEALNPAQLVLVMGPSDADSMPRFGAVGLRSAMSRVRSPGPSVVRTPDLRVSAGQAMGWFATHVDLLPVQSGGRPTGRVRLSGVFVRERGDWRLVQAHLSQAQPGADSAAIASSPDSAAAPAEDE